MSDSENKTELIRKAFEYKSKKQYKEAISTLRSALELNVDTHENAEIYSQIGELYLIMEDSDSALKEFQNALVINGSHKFSIQKCFDIYFKKEQYQKALYIAQKICENERNAITYLNYFKVLYKLEKFQDIIEIFNSLNEDIKLEPDILYLISLVDKEKQEMLLKKILEIDESHENANLDLAQIAFKNKDLNLLIKCCINLDENIPEVSYYLGIIEIKNKNYNKAISYIVNAIKKDKNKNDYYFDLAKAYIDITYYVEAIESLSLSIKHSLMTGTKENLDEKYFLIGWLLYKKEDYQNALLNLNMVDKNSKFHTNAEIIIQAINMQIDNSAKVKDKLEKMYVRQSENIILLDTLAIVYKNLKMTKNAIKIYNKALKLHPESLFYRLELIDLYIDINMYSDAMTQIEQVKKINKNCVNIYNSLARIYYRLNDYTNALANIDEYLNLDKNNAESYYFKGLILNDLNKFEDAKTSIYSAITLKPDNAKYYSQMARSYFGLGQYEDALLYSKEAIELSPSDINYKKQGYEIALKLDDKEKISLYEKQLKRSESILKNM